MAIQSFRTFLRAPEPDCSLSQLNGLFYNPDISSDVTFWGERVITVKGEEGAVPLHVLADKVVSVICARCLTSNTQSFDKNIYDKGQAAFIVDHLVQCYSLTDTLIARANLFTKILAKIRDFRFTNIRAYVNTHYLHNWGFEAGYDINRCLWDDDVPPAWFGARND